MLAQSARFENVVLKTLRGFVKLKKFQIPKKKSEVGGWWVGQAPTWIFIFSRIFGFSLT